MCHLSIVHTQIYKKRDNIEMTWWITKFDDFVNYDNQRKRGGPKES